MPSVVKNPGATELKLGFMSSSSLASYPSTLTVELLLLSVMSASSARETDFTPGSAAKSSWSRLNRARRRAGS